MTTFVFFLRVFVMCAQLQPADTVVERMLTHMTSQEPGYRYFNIDPGRPHIVTVLVSTR